MSTHNIQFLNMKKKITLSYTKSAAMRFFQGTKERVRNSSGKRVISVRATEGLLYFRFTGMGPQILYTRIVSTTCLF